MQSDLGIDARRYQSWPARSASFSTSAGAAFSLPGGMRIVRNVNPAASRMRTTASSHVIPPAVSRIGTVPRIRAQLRNSAFRRLPPVLSGAPPFDRVPALRLRNYRAQLCRNKC